MEEISGPPLRAKWCNSAASCSESSDASDPKKTRWLSNAIEAHREYFTTKNPHSIGRARASMEDGDKSSQVSTIGVSGISEDSEIGTLPSGGEPALASSESDHQKTETSVVLEAVPDVPQNEYHEETAQMVHPTLLGCAALRSNGRQTASTVSPWNISRLEGERNQGSRWTPPKWSTLSRVQTTASDNLEAEQQVLQKGTATPPHSHPLGGQVPEKSVRYSRQFLLGIFLSSETLTREKTKQRLQPPPGYHFRLDRFKDVLGDTEQEGRGAVSEFKRSLRRKSRPLDVAKIGASLPDRCLTEERQTARDLFTRCNINYVSCISRATRGATHVGNCYEIGLSLKSNTGTQYTSTAVPLTPDGCRGSRSWITSLCGGVRTKPCMQLSTARGGPSLPNVCTGKENASQSPEQADPAKSRGYNGKWKCPVMPSGVNSTTR